MRLLESVIRTFAIVCALLLIGCGSNTTPVPTPPVPIPPVPTPPPPGITPKFAYVSSDAGSVSAFQINGATGALKTVPGSPFAGGGEYAYSIALHPKGNFVYTANGGTFNISAFSIDANSGALNAVPGSPFPTGDNPFGVMVHSLGNFLYVASTVVSPPKITIAAYSIDPSTGALTELDGSPFATTAQSLVALAQDRSGKFLYGVDIAAGQVLAYSIDQSSGSLTSVPGSPFAAGTYPFSIAADPVADFIFVVNEGDNNVSGSVSAYAIDPRSGTLSAVRGSPFETDSMPLSVAIEPRGKFLYITHPQYAATVSGYQIDSAGKLTAIPGSPFSVGSSPYKLAVDPSGKFVYVTDSSLSELLGLKIAVDGSLSPIPDSTVDLTGLGPEDIVVLGAVQ